MIPSRLQTLSFAHGLDDEEQIHGRVGCVHITSLPRKATTDWGKTWRESEHLYGVGSAVEAQSRNDRFK